MDINCVNAESCLYIDVFCPLSIHGVSCNVKCNETSCAKIKLHIEDSKYPLLNLSCITTTNSSCFDYDARVFCEDNYHYSLLKYNRYD